MPASDSHAASGFTSTYSSAKPTLCATAANASALRAEIAPRATGRSFVRVMSRSMSRSHTQFSAPADAAESAPPSSVHSVSSSGGTPRAAITIAARVVISSR